MIRIKNLTKDYGANRGVFDLSFEVQDAETFGLLGLRGAGKTTVLQILMGFSEASSGRCTVHAKNCWKQTVGIKCFTGYLPQKISFPENMTGLTFFQFLAGMRGLKSLEKAIRTAEHFELDTSKKIRKMNPEEKKELAVSAALLHDPQVLLLDEPDMDLGANAQVRLMELILQEKSREKTILLCTERFSTAERMCDRIGILKRGSLVNLDNVSAIRRACRKVFCISFRDEQEAIRFVRQENFEVLSKNGAQLSVAFSEEVQTFIEALSRYHVLTLENIPQTLDETFSYLSGGDFRD